MPKHPSSVRHAPSEWPRHPTESDETSLTLSGNLTALHRGLLIVLTLAVLALVPAIVVGGSRGSAWTEPPATPIAGTVSGLSTLPMGQSTTPIEAERSGEGPVRRSGAAAAARPD